METGRRVGVPPSNFAQVTDGVKADDKKRKSAQFALKHNAKQNTNYIARKIGGLNVTQGLARVRGLPVLCIIGDADGIVPPAAALAALGVLGHDAVDVLEVGDDRDGYAHADLFIAREARERVFEPMRAWLREQA